MSSADGRSSGAPKAERSKSFDLEERAAGLLLHVTSLPGPHGNGDIGPEARRFVEFLERAGQRWWQMLPVNPAGEGNSPYSGVSAFAGNPLLISLHDLVSDGLLAPSDVAFRIDAPRASYASAAVEREKRLRKAFANYRRKPGQHRRGLERFRAEAAFWLADYALYMALRRRLEHKPWTEWPSGIARRRKADLERARKELAEEIAYFEFEQFSFRRQWARLRAHAREHGVGLIGDAPIFVAHESADVWSSSRFFTLDRAGRATHVSGVPPDYFSKTGQRWGNPLYRWRTLAGTGYRWWIERFRTLLEHFDAVRLDHFIGFSRYWEVPAAEKTAEKGTWRRGPGQALFDAVRDELGHTPFIAEDLGEVTPEVRRVRDAAGLPGMRVLQFAFGNDLQANDFLPHRYVPRAVAYTGTHDNDTFVGWFDDPGGSGRPRSARQAAKERRAAQAYLQGPDAHELGGGVHWAALRAVYASVANVAIVPMQDALGLGNEARMNMPGRAHGNWEWRLGARSASASLAARLRRHATVYERASEARVEAPSSRRS